MKRKDGRADFEGTDLLGEKTKVAALLRFPGQSGAVDSPFLNDAKGSVKFWLKDGTLSKYEARVSAKVGIAGQDLDRTITVEINDVGATKVEVPVEAQRKLR